MCEPFPEVWRPSVEALLRNFDFWFFMHHVAFCFEVFFLIDGRILRGHILVLVSKGVNFFHGFFLFFRRLFSFSFGYFWLLCACFLPHWCDFAWGIAAKFRIINLDYGSVHPCCEYTFTGVVLLSSV